MILTIKLVNTKDGFQVISGEKDYKSLYDPNIETVLYSSSSASLADEALRRKIKYIVDSGLYHITVADTVNKIFECQPKQQAFLNLINLLVNK